MQLTLAQAAGWLTGAQVVGDSATAVARVHSDTRTLRPGDLFVALKGERFDAAQFLAQARTQGAVAALCQRDARGLLEAAGLPGILVDDVRRALGELAHGWRRQFELPLIAVTGSN
ncbi:MAG: UDP-N-acetylmuramoylalanyl-D-glutamyl-2, 6-diaminopimelate--D-alanyl-D-alanine ligase, partial [Ottowia sp.]|nr:UDP-N-acetylmuramoylalanyl-D-glutamyl-2, 6-diaminopimelate--D-alanyl-D-alanine ligase [Ottowia sp.]